MRALPLPPTPHSPPLTAFFIEFAARIRPHLTHAKLAVTGGFRSTPAMANALREKSCDLIGLGRPLTAEPDLSALLIAGNKVAAKGNKVPAALQTGSAIFQIKDVRFFFAVLAGFGEVLMSCFSRRSLLESRFMTWRTRRSRRISRP